MTTLASIFLYVFAADLPRAQERPSNEVRLFLIPNTTNILQRDLVRVMAVVENGTAADVRLFHRRSGGPPYIRFHVKDKDGWRRAPTVEEELTKGGAGYGRVGVHGRPVLADSSFVEFGDIHRVGRSFLFEDAGKHELRASVFVGESELFSDPVTITVKARPAENLRRIEQASNKIQLLGIRCTHWDLTDNLLALADVGGNTEQALRDAKTFQEYVRNGTVDGEPVAKDKLCSVLRQRLDPVTFEMGLEFLGAHYMQREDREGMQHVADAMPHDSSWRRDMRRSLRFPMGVRGTTRHDLGQTGEDKIRILSD